MTSHYTLHLLHVDSAPLDPRDDNVDVVVTLLDGRRFGATFFTLQNIKTLMERHSRTGENAGGTYFWASDMILVEELSEPIIRATIEELLSDDALEAAFSLLS